MTVNRAAAAIVAIYLGFGFGYSVLMPIWEAPDERAHYGYAFTIARTGEPPSNEQNYESFQPPLYYRIAAVPIMLISAFDPALARPFMPPSLPMEEGHPRYIWTTENYEFLLAPLALRWMGLFFGGISLMCLYVAVRRTIPSEPALALGTIALAGGIPQFIHISASINNDALAILAGALLFYGLSRVCREESFSPGWLVLFLLALVLPMVVKLTVLPIGLAAAAAVLHRTWAVRDRLPNRLFAASAVLTVSALVAVPVIFPGTVERVLEELVFRLLRVRPDVWEGSILNILNRYLRSFWGKVGWLAIGIPVPAVIALTGLSGLGLVAVLRSLLFKGEMDNSHPAGRRLLLASLLAIGIAGLMLLNNYLSSPQLQGRFLFPTIGPIALLIVFGWSRLLGDRRRLLVPLIIVLFALLNLHLWITGVIPVYFQPFLDR